KPTAKYIGVLNWSEPPHIVPSQLKIFTPVGMAINIVAREKKVSEIGPMPVVNMWWLHTPKPRKAMNAPEKTIAAYPKSGFREKTGSTSEMSRNAGSTRM